MLLEQKKVKPSHAGQLILMVGVLVLVTSCSSLKSNPVATASGKGIIVKKVVFKNGLTVLVAANPRLPIVSYYTLFDVGGRDEGPGTTGATHFLEHMMFKGAKKYGPGKFDTMIERSGGSTNAYTTSDMTVYYQNIPKDFLPQMIDLEADRIQNLLLEPVAFESERAVIFEERKMRYENSPDGLLYLEMMKKIFEGTPYGQSVIGDEADLKALSRDQMMTFFKTYYVPNNAIVAIAGDVDPDQVIKMMQEKFESIPASTKLAGIKKQKSDAEIFVTKAKYGVEYKVYATNPNPKFVLAFPAEKLGTRKAYVMDVVANMLGHGGSSYLAQRYVKSDDPLLQEISLYNYNLTNAGVFHFTGELAEGKKVEDAKAALMNDLGKMCESAMDERTLQKTKNQIMANGYHNLKSNSGVASDILLNEKWYADPNYNLKAMEIYNSVTVIEALKTCKEVLEKTPNIFISVWDKYPKPGEKQ